jgi:hypothetical protein
MSKKVYKKLTDCEDVFENNISTLGCFEEKHIDTNESKNLSKEENNPACKVEVDSILGFFETKHIAPLKAIDNKNNGWNIVNYDKKRNNRKTNLKMRQKKKDSKTLAKFAKIPCRNYPGCKWKKECWYLHKDKMECLPNKLKRCRNGKPTLQDAQVKKSENTKGKGCDEEIKSIVNHLKKAFPCQNINGDNETIDVNMCSDDDYGQKKNNKRENKPPKCTRQVREILLIEKANKYTLKPSIVKVSF